MFCSLRAIMHLHFLFSSSFRAFDMQACKPESILTDCLTALCLTVALSNCSHVGNQSCLTVSLLTVSLLHVRGQRFPSTRPKLSKSAARTFQERGHSFPSARPKASKYAAIACQVRGRSQVRDQSLDTTSSSMYATRAWQVQVRGQPTRPGVIKAVRRREGTKKDTITSSEKVRFATLVKRL